MKTSVCIDMMFKHLPFYERTTAVKNAGLDAVEFWRWSDKDIDKICHETKRLGLSVAVVNIDSDDEMLSCDLLKGIINSGRKTEFLKAVEQTLPVLERLSAYGMIVLSGEENDDLSYEEQIYNICDCLQAAAPLLKGTGRKILLEPLNTFDRPNYFLKYPKQGFEVINKVADNNIKLLYDVYHAQLMEGNLINTIKENIRNIGHIHIADAPGRHQPGTGEINFKNLLAVIKENGYDGYLGLEYRATKKDETTFDFLNV